MLNNILDDFLRILKGKNGTIFLVILAVVAVMVFLKVLPTLIWLAVVGGLIFLAFKFFEKKS